jgi:hypothetical protein
LKQTEPDVILRQTRNKSASEHTTRQAEGARRPKPDENSKALPVSRNRLIDTNQHFVLSITHVHQMPIVKQMLYFNQNAQPGGMYDERLRLADRHRWLRIPSYFPIEQI